jgi:peptidoglycan hydrolase-like protein with peptidoglycan-binding domain
VSYLRQELRPDEVGDLSVLEASSPAPEANLPRRPGESLGSWGKRLKAGDASLAAKQKKGQRTRSGGSATAFSQAHPRGRGGQWIFKQGASGAEVKAIQSRVGVKTDGSYGKLTTQAVMAFQRRHGLQVDGRVGAQTVAAMRGKQRAAQVKAGAMSAADRQWLLRHR